MPAKIPKTGEDKETGNTVAKPSIKVRRVNEYLTKITNSQKRARRTQTEINRLKKRTDAVLAKLT